MYKHYASDVPKTPYRESTMSKIKHVQIWALISFKVFIHNFLSGDERAVKKFMNGPQRLGHQFL